MNNPPLWHESQVKPEEIDSLGHMNVRFYVSRMDAANRALLARCGVEPGPGQVLRRVDTYTRFHREQFAGAPLNTYGGLMAGEGVLDDGGVNAYFEIRNPESGQTAATFIVASSLVDKASEKVMRDVQVSRDPGLEVSVPDMGLPRSLSLREPAHVAMSLLEESISDDPTPGMMSGRREATVSAEDCDENGRMHEHVDLMFVLHRPQADGDEPTHGPPVVRDSEGRRYSWAMMETRSVVWRRPALGDRIVSIGADIRCGEKWRQSRRWMFVKETVQPLGISDTLGMCIDLDARRAIVIPDDVRAAIEKNAVPQFA